MAYRKVNRLPNVKRVTDELWDELNAFIFPHLEKPAKVIGHPAVSLGKVLDGYFVCIKNWTSMEDVAKGVWVLVQHVIDDSNNGQDLKYLRDYRLGCQKCVILSRISMEIAV